MKHLLILFFIGALTFANVSSTYSQCAMCRATVESNSKSGDRTIGRGLNTGILYLMAVPYILISVVGYLWYTNSKKNAKRSSAMKNSERSESSFPTGEVV